MSVNLLDVNVLVSLVRPQQPGHSKVVEWFRENRGESWATCPLTEAGFVRVASKLQFTSHPLSMNEVLRMLAEITKLPGHQFWPLAFCFTEAVVGLEDRFFGHQQVTDLYLLALAIRNKGRLVTLDHGIAGLAGREYQRYVALL